MKKYSICIIVLLAACFFLESCVSSQSRTPKQDAEPSATEFTPVITEGVVLFDRNDPEGPRLELRLALSEPAKSGSGIGNLVRELLYKGQSAADYGKAVAAEHEKLYAELHAQRPPEEAPGESFNWYYMEKVENKTIPVKGFMPGREKLLVLSKTTESYLGGAHPNSFTESFVIDPAAVKRLTLGDIFGSREEPRSLLEAELRRKNQLPEGAPLSEAGFFTDRIELPENFFLTEKAGDSPFMHFLWNAYEIAPYAMGAIEVSLPLKGLSPFFRK
jgi:hypothetical protein